MCTRSAWCSPTATSTRYRCLCGAFLNRGTKTCQTTPQRSEINRRCQSAEKWSNATPTTGRYVGRFIIEYRAQNRCEWCGARKDEPNPETGSRVVLTLAHVWDKAPEDSSLLNLAALCQRCHNRWDAQGRRMNRIRRRVAELLRSGQLPLPWPPAVSMAMELYQLLIEAGELAPAETQLKIPRSAYEYVA